MACGDQAATGPCWCTRVQFSADLRAFNETFVFLATMTALALLAAWKMGEAPTPTKKD